MKKRAGVERPLVSVCLSHKPATQSDVFSWAVARILRAPITAAAPRAAAGINIDDVVSPSRPDPVPGSAGVKQ